MGSELLIQSAEFGHCIHFRTGIDMSEGLTPNGSGMTAVERTLSAPPHLASAALGSSTDQVAGTDGGVFPRMPGAESPAPAEQSSELEPRQSWLDAVLAATSTLESRPGFLAQWLAESSPNKALQLWVKERFSSGEPLTRQSVVRRLSQDLAALDQILTRQVNAILHHPRFQQLEASWRGLWYLTGEAKENLDRAEFDEKPPKIEIRLLNFSKQNLSKDLLNAVEFDQSQCFKKIYEEGLGIAGGHPFGAVIGDYQFTSHVEDIDLLEKISQVAAAAFCPFIASASPQLLGLESFCTLERPLRLEESFGQLDYLKWNAFRAQNDSRFIGLALPRVLMREPYLNDGSRADGFCFHEEVSAPDRSAYLWGSASYAFGAVLLRAFASCRWFADIRGFQRGIEGGGLVTGLPSHSFATDRTGVAVKSSTEVSISEFHEKELSTLGFIPLCHCKDTDYSVFYTNSSVQKPTVYSESDATANSKISAMLQYVMCVSRFAHYLKCVARDKIGGHATEQELQRYLKGWIANYVADVNCPPKLKSKYPLREAQIEVRETPAKPGSYNVTMRLLPHYQLDGLTMGLRLVTKMGLPSVV